MQLLQPPMCHCRLIDTIIGGTRPLGQVVRQFPTAFEFSEAALAFLASHLYAGFVTTFRHNSHAEHAADAAASRSTSVWAQLLSRAVHLRNVRNGG